MSFSTYHEIIAFELRASIRRYTETWEEVLWGERHPRELYLKTVEQHRIPIVVLSCTLLESTINFFLCTKCSAKRFKEIERDRKLGSLFNKWMKAPQLFVHTCIFPWDSPLRQDLRKLIDRRNVIVHNQPMISVDGDNRHKGNEPAFALDEHEFIGRCATLPFRLIEFLMVHDPDARVELFNHRIYCGTVASEYEGGQQRAQVASKYPPQLITEIMQQGYNFRIAIQCAILIGDDPKPDENGIIAIRFHGREIARLKPLKYFAKVPTKEDGSR